MYPAFPLHIDQNGNIVTCDLEEHIIQMMEQFLFTDPYERVNRPDFGGGVTQMVFGALNDEVATTLQFHLQARMQQLFSTEISLQGVDVWHEESRLTIRVNYKILQTGQDGQVEYKRSIQS